MCTQRLPRIHGSLSICPPGSDVQRLKEARQIQINTFVGRSTHATAASKRQRQSLYAVEREATRCPSSGTHFASSSAWSSCSSSRRPYLSVFSSPTTSIDQCHGHWWSAMMVKVVSRQFDNVRVETNHCHGLETVKNNYKGGK